MKDVFASAGEEIVEAEHFIAFANQPLTKMRADKSSATRDKNSHLSLHLLCATSVVSVSLWLCSQSGITTEAQRTQRLHRENQTEALTSQRVIPEIKHIHLSLSETFNRFLRRANNRLILIERRIENYRDTSQIREIGNQLIIPFIEFPRDCL